MQQARVLKLSLFTRLSDLLKQHIVPYSYARATQYDSGDVTMMMKQWKMCMVDKLDYINM